MNFRFKWVQSHLPSQIKISLYSLQLNYSLTSVVKDNDIIKYLLLLLALMRKRFKNPKFKRNRFEKLR